jgi:hypothetical protein
MTFGGCVILISSDITWDRELTVSAPVEFQEFELEHIIGSGASGKVHLGKWKGNDVAIKICQKSNAGFDVNEFYFEVRFSTFSGHKTLHLTSPPPPPPPPPSSPPPPPQSS